MPLFNLREQKRLWFGGNEQTSFYLGGELIWPVEQPSAGRLDMNVKTLGLAMPWNELVVGGTTWLNDMDTMNVPVIRFDFYFDGIQKTTGGAYDWSDVEPMVDAALARGIQVLPILNGSPPNTSFNETYADAAHRVAFGQFCGAAAAHFAGRVDHWAIYNEPNLFKMTPENYSLLIAQAAPAIRAANPNAFIVGPNLASVDVPTSGLLTNNGDWMSRMYAAGGNVYYDALGFHPYTYPNWPSDEAGYSGLRQMVDVVRPAMVAAGEGHKKIWITEYGYPSSGSGTGSSWYSPVYQEEVLQEFVDWIDPLDWVGPAFWYTYRDRGGATGDMENWFGVRGPTGTAKPAYASIIALMAAYPAFQRIGGEVQGPSIDDIPGLSWSTATPIVSTPSGAINDPIPLSITSGAVYAAFSFDVTRSSDGAKRAYFSLQTQDQWGNGFHGMSVFTSWGEARIGDTIQARANIMLPADISGKQTWEVFWSADNVSIITENNGENVGAGLALPEILQLRIGHESNWGSVEARHDQTIYRMRLYNRIPTSEEREIIKSWVSAGGTTDPEVPVPIEDGMINVMAGTTPFDVDVKGSSADNPALPFLISHHGLGAMTSGSFYNTTSIASAFGVVAFSPWFDSPRFTSGEYQRGGYPDGNRSAQLEAPLVEALRARLGAPDRLALIIGHSAGGQWLSRVAAHNPVPNVQRYVVGNPSTWVWPSNAASPYGFGGMGLSSAQIDDAIRAYVQLPLTVYVGELDTEVDADLADPTNQLGQGVNRRDRAENAYAAAAAAASSYGVPLGWEKVVAAGVGHAGTSMLNAPERQQAFFPPAGNHAVNLAVNGGVGAGLRLAIDPASGLSYPGTGQIVSDFMRDLKFARGFGIGAEGSDMTFNGVANALNSSAYFSTDGTDFLTLQGTNPEWINDMHQPGMNFTYAGLIYVPAIGNWFDVTGTMGVSGNGFSIGFNDNANMNLYVDGGGTNRFSGSSSAAAAARPGVWGLYMLSFQQGVSRRFARRTAADGYTSNTGTSTMTGQSTGAALHSLQFGGCGNGEGRAHNGTRFGPQWFWDRALTDAQLNAFSAVAFGARG